MGAKSSKAIDPGTPDVPSYKTVGRCFFGDGRASVVLLCGSVHAMWSRMGHGEDDGWTETIFDAGDGRGKLES